MEELVVYKDRANAASNSLRQSDAIQPSVKAWIK